jgi:hypothetical protein
MPILEAQVGPDPNPAVLFQFVEAVPQRLQGDVSTPQSALVLNVLAHGPFQAVVAMMAPAFNIRVPMQQLQTMCLLGAKTRNMMVMQSLKKLSPQAMERRFDGTVPTVVLDAQTRVPSLASRREQLHERPKMSPLCFVCQLDWLTKQCHRLEGTIEQKDSFNEVLECSFALPIHIQVTEAMSVLLPHFDRCAIRSVLEQNRDSRTCC